MTAFDWFLVLAINGSIIAYGLYLARTTQSSSEWFLAARALPWWAIGLSMFATNVDNADLVGVTGQTFKEGLHVITVYALGSAVGGILAAFYIVPKISRRGFYTNAEYLEARYGPSCRILSALIQIQYRTSMLGLIIWSTYLGLTMFVDLSPKMAWLLIVVLVVLSGLYTAWGGLKSVVWTDCAQGIVLLVAALVIFSAVWNSVGGWTGMEQTLINNDAANDTQQVDLLHVGRYCGDNGVISPWLVALGWTIIGAGYWTVNHTQTMRLMGARSINDMKYAAVFGVTLSLPVMIASACLGVFAHGLVDLPEGIKPDEVYLYLANQFLGPGLKGLVVAGMVAAAVSTFDSMGSALSAIFTRDVYARLIASDRDDEHYVKVGRFATAGVLLIGFAYLPFIWKQPNMLKAFTTLIPVFVTPLFTIYIMGVFTRAHRRSGLTGLLWGSAYGVIALVDRQFHDFTWLQPWFTERWVALLWSIVFTVIPMVVVTVIQGRSTEAEELAWSETGWLQRSRESLPPFEADDASTNWLPNVAAIAMLALCAWVTFGLFW